MLDLNVQSRDPVEGNAVASAETSSSTVQVDKADSQVAACEKLVDNAVEKDLPVTVLADSLKDLGLKAIEATDYIEKFYQRVKIRRSKVTMRLGHESPPREPSTELPASVQDQEKQVKAVEEAAWESLRSKFEAATPATPSRFPSNIDRIELVVQKGPGPSSTSLSKPPPCEPSASAELPASVQDQEKQVKAAEETTSLRSKLEAATPATSSRFQVPSNILDRIVLEFFGQKNPGPSSTSLPKPPLCEFSASAELPASVQDQEMQVKTIEEAAWASVRSQLEAAIPATPSRFPSNILERIMLELFGQESPSSTSLSKSVLAVTPHLADDDGTVFKSEDPYLSETQKCKVAYAGQKPFENLLIKAQGRKVREPIANSIWRLVILDKYVDFEKLYATLDPSYNLQDEAEELNDRFTPLERNSISTKRSVCTEAEWMRLYDVWVEAVLHFYPHRRAELSSYRELIISMFLATLSPFQAIKYDCDFRERYARQPYHLDSIKDVLPFPLLLRLLSYAEPSFSSFGNKKRPGDNLEGPRKRSRSKTICYNWNLGTCEGDTCRFGRRHNECSECNGFHRAKDKSKCYAAFNQRELGPVSDQ